jgi:anti-sigma regulatory factor (Ser/Thr protein kinase)
VCTVTPTARCELPATTAAPRMGREFLSEASCRTHPSSRMDDLALLASEAITNAVVHGLPPLTLTVECQESHVEVRVSDASSRLPEGRDPDDVTEGGRGIMLVDLLSDAWGTDVDGDTKEVWFRVTR